MALGCLAAGTAAGFYFEEIRASSNLWNGFFRPHGM